MLWLATVPAIVVMASVLWLIVILAGPRTSEYNWYAQQAAMALDRGDANSARLSYQSLLQRQPDNPTFQFGMAMCLLHLGDEASAAAIIRDLAPEDAAGYPDAQAFLGEQLLADPQATPETVARAEKHLKSVLQAAPKDMQANALMAIAYVRQDQWDLAEKHIALAGPRVDEIALEAAQAYTKRGDTARAQQFAQRAIVYYAQRTNQVPADDESRLKCAQAALLFHDYALAIQALEGGWKATKKPVYPQMIARATALWLSSPGLEAPRRMALLENGLRWDAQEPTLLQMLTDRDTLDDASQVRPATEPIAGAAVRALCASISACRRQDGKAAQAELAAALQLSDNAFVPIAANVACTWAYSQKPDHEAAATLSAALVQLRPAEPVARRAQGLVLARFSKWQECVTYLEPVAREMPADTMVHETLAAAYEHMGMPDEAAEQSRLAQPATAPATQAR